MKILVVEDDPNTRAALIGCLTPRFEEVSSVETGEACLECYSGYDLIVLDWNLPNMSGLAAAKRIKENAPGPLPVIILLTGRHRKSEDAEAYGCGVSHVMDKLDPDLLYKIVWNARLVEKKVDRPAMPERRPE